ncbi:hypothetical protein FORMB_23990 [Formosa sp. Hel1_33_131]|nr:hypothetical protein FORMB_23990 [Formosa sp. Hel1_33_131]
MQNAFDTILCHWKFLGRLIKRRKPGDLPYSKNNVKLSG